jgi:hypothetical protein
LNTRWCPRCGERWHAETFVLLHDQAYVGRRRARVYRHVPCSAIVVALLRYNQSDTG